MLDTLVRTQDTSKTLQTTIETQEAHIKQLVSDAMQQEEKFEKFR